MGIRNYGGGSAPGGGGDDAAAWAEEGNTDTIPNGKIPTNIAAGKLQRLLASMDEANDPSITNRALTPADGVTNNLMFRITAPAHKNGRYWELLASQTLDVYVSKLGRYSESAQADFDASSFRLTAGNIPFLIAATAAEALAWLELGDADQVILIPSSGTGTTLTVTLSGAPTTDTYNSIPVIHFAATDFSASGYETTAGVDYDIYAIKRNQHLDTSAILLSDGTYWKEIRDGFSAVVWADTEPNGLTGLLWHLTDDNTIDLETGRLTRTGHNVEANMTANGIFYTDANGLYIAVPDAATGAPWTDLESGDKIVLLKDGEVAVVFALTVSPTYTTTSFDGTDITNVHIALGLSIESGTFENGAVYDVIALEAGETVKSGDTVRWTNAYWELVEEGGAASAALVQATAPASPSLGQEWYDTQEEVLKVWDNTAWRLAAKESGLTFVSAIPASPETGQQIALEVDLTVPNLDVDEITRTAEADASDLGSNEFVYTTDAGNTIILWTSGTDTDTTYSDLEVNDKLYFVSAANGTRVLTINSAPVRSNLAGTHAISFNSNSATGDAFVDGVSYAIIAVSVGGESYTAGTVLQWTGDYWEVRYVPSGSDATDFDIDALDTVTPTDSDKIPLADVSEPDNPNKAATVSDILALVPAAEDTGATYAGAIPASPANAQQIVLEVDLTVPTLAVDNLTRTSSTANLIAAGEFQYNTTDTSFAIVVGSATAYQTLIDLVAGDMLIFASESNGTRILTLTAALVRTTGNNLNFISTPAGNDLELPTATGDAFVDNVAYTITAVSITGKTRTAGTALEWSGSYWEVVYTPEDIPDAFDIDALDTATPHVNDKVPLADVSEGGNPNRAATLTDILALAPNTGGGVPLPKIVNTTAQVPSQADQALGERIFIAGANVSLEQYLSKVEDRTKISGTATGDFVANAIQVSGGNLIFHLGSPHAQYFVDNLGTSHNNTVVFYSVDGSVTVTITGDNVARISRNSISEVVSISGGSYSLSGSFVNDRTYTCYLVAGSTTYPKRSIFQTDGVYFTEVFDGALDISEVDWDSDIASKLESEHATGNNKLMTPLRVGEAIDALTLRPYYTESLGNFTRSTQNNPTQGFHFTLINNQSHIRISKTNTDSESVATQLDNLGVGDYLLFDEDVTYVVTSVADVTGEPTIKNIGVSYVSGQTSDLPAAGSTAEVFIQRIPLADDAIWNTGISTVKAPTVKQVADALDEMTNLAPVWQDTPPTNPGTGQIWHLTADNTLNIQTADFPRDYTETAADITADSMYFIADDALYIILPAGNTGAAFTALGENDLIVFGQNGTVIRTLTLSASPTIESLDVGDDSYQTIAVDTTNYTASGSALVAGSTYDVIAVQASQTQHTSDILEFSGYYWQVVANDGNVDLTNYMHVNFDNAALNDQARSDLYAEMSNNRDDVIQYAEIQQITRQSAAIISTEGNFFIGENNTLTIYFSSAGRALWDELIGLSTFDNYALSDPFLVKLGDAYYHVTSNALTSDTPPRNVINTVHVRGTPPAVGDTAQLEIQIPAARQTKIVNTTAQVPSQTQSKNRDRILIAGANVSVQEYIEKITREADTSTDTADLTATKIMVDTAGNFLIGTGSSAETSVWTGLTADDFIIAFHPDGIVTIDLNSVPLAATINSINAVQVQAGAYTLTGTLVDAREYTVYALKAAAVQSVGTILESDGNYSKIIYQPAATEDESKTGTAKNKFLTVAQVSQKVAAVSTPIVEWNGNSGVAPWSTERPPDQRATQKGAPASDTYYTAPTGSADGYIELVSVGSGADTFRQNVQFTNNNINWSQTAFMFDLAQNHFDNSSLMGFALPSDAEIVNSSSVRGLASGITIWNGRRLSSGGGFPNDGRWGVFVSLSSFPAGDGIQQSIAAANITVYNGATISTTDSNRNSVQLPEASNQDRNQIIILMRDDGRSIDYYMNGLRYARFHLTAAEAASNLAGPSFAFNGDTGSASKWVRLYDFAAGAPALTKQHPRYDFLEEAEDIAPEAIEPYHLNTLAVAPTQGKIITFSEDIGSFVLEPRQKHFYLGSGDALPAEADNDVFDEDFVIWKETAQNVLTKTTVVARNAVTTDTEDNFAADTIQYGGAGNNLYIYFANTDDLTPFNNLQNNDQIICERVSNGDLFTISLTGTGTSVTRNSLDNTLQVLSSNFTTSGTDLVSGEAYSVFAVENRSYLRNDVLRFEDRVWEQLISNI